MSLQAHGAEKQYGENDMVLDNYVFAAYVFLLACVGIWLLGRVLKKSKKASGEPHTSYEKEQKLFTLYQNVEDMLAGFEEYVEEAKKETAKSMAKMQEMMDETRSLAAQMKTMQSSSSPSEIEPVVSEPLQKMSIKEDTPPPMEQAKSMPIVKPTLDQPVPLRQTSERKGSKTGNKVAELFAAGMSHNDIAKRLGISVREVSLALKIANAEETK